MRRARSWRLLPLSLIAAVVVGCGPGVESTGMRSARSARSTALEVLKARTPAPLTWETVVNNGTLIPTGAGKTFSSYNQPSVNGAGLVVFRARSIGSDGRGEGELTVAAPIPGTGPVHGIFTRDMAVAGAPGAVTLIVRNRGTSERAPYNTVPAPNNLDAPFTEFPSIPRIDQRSSTIATRGQSRPVWQYAIGFDEATQSPLTTRVGTSGIYANPSGTMTTAASLLGTVLADYIVPSFAFPWFQVPGVEVPARFDQFPGAPGLAGPDTIVFKGNWTHPTTKVGHTGVYFRKLTAMNDPVVQIADNVGPTTLSTGATLHFGSTAPPSGAMNETGAYMVFVGLDDEDAPTAGGIYLSKLSDVATERIPRPLATIGGDVPGFDGQSIGATFTRFGEGLSYDGPHVAFWGAWGTATRTVHLTCPTDGNAAMIAACVLGSADGLGHYAKDVPQNQGFFVHDTVKNTVAMLARTGTEANGFEDFLFWNFSGRPPGTGGGDEPTLEPPRWRSNAFAALSSPGGSKCQLAYKGLKTVDVVGIYLSKSGAKEVPALVVVDTNTPATALDPTAPTTMIDEDGVTVPTELVVTAVGIERDGFRSGGDDAGSFLVINASMANEDASVTWGGIYLSRFRAD